MKINCPNCGYKYDVLFEDHGKEAECNNCNTSFIIKNPNVIDCPICEKPIAKNSINCIHCGHSFKKDEVRKTPKGGFVKGFLIAILLIIGIDALSFFIPVLILGITVLSTCIWVLIDAKNIGIKAGQINGFSDMGAWGWFFCCLLLWIIAFPCYLVQRPKYKYYNDML